MTTTPIEPTTQSLRALIVDDDPRWRAIIAEVLSELGWSITAMDTPPADVSGYHLAVLDIALDPILARNREGLALIQHVTAQGTPCVVLSGLEDEDLVTQIAAAATCSTSSPRLLSGATCSSRSCGKLAHQR